MTLTEATTESGSVYQIDYRSKRIRRLKGVQPGTPRQGRDEEWQVFDDVVQLEDGTLLIFWEKGSKPTLEETQALGLEHVMRPCTRTTRIVSVQKITLQ